MGALDPALTGLSIGGVDQSRTSGMDMSWLDGETDTDSNMDTDSFSDVDSNRGYSDSDLDHHSCPNSDSDSGSSSDSNLPSDPILNEPQSFVPETGRIADWAQSVSRILFNDSWRG